MDGLVGRDRELPANKSKLNKTTQGARRKEV